MKPVTPKMLNALVSLFGNDLQEPSNFHPATIKGLISRGLVEINLSGYMTFTETGIKWLVDNRYAVMSEDIRISASTTQLSHEEISNEIRLYHEGKALDKFNIGIPARIKKVDDTLNNAGRRCNIKNNGDTESRCWEIVMQFDYCGTSYGPTSETLYIVRYVGKEWLTYYTPYTSPYYMTDLSYLTNLY